MVAAKSHATALFHRTVRVQHVISRAAAHIDHQRAKILLMLGEYDLRRSKPTKNNVLHIQRQLFDAPDGILDPGAHAMDDMKIGFQFLPKHPDRVQHTVLSVDMIMLNERMKECVLRRNAHLTRVNLYVLDVP